MSSLLIRNGVLVTMNDAFDIVHGDVSIRDGRIAAIGPETDRFPAPHDAVINVHDAWVLPGFVQTHVHLCQTLFRGFADDLSLMDWLRTRVWPLEAAHTAATLRAAARLGITELLASGTTTVLTMETVHDTDVVFDAAAQAGIRATIGKCMMDAAAEDGIPIRLRETTLASLDESVAIGKRWDGTSQGRLRAAFAPRFAVSCSRALLEDVASLSEANGTLVHTHASESRDELTIVRRLTGGLSNVEYLARLRLASPRLCAAHCVWADDREQVLLAEHDVKVLHCPSSNLKLGSGIAPVTSMRGRGISVSLGADGAACNNHLDMFTEMRLAALLQAVAHGPGTLTARDALAMATRDGAAALGLGSDIGSLEPGKRADIIVIDRDRPHLLPGVEPYSTIVYAARATDVRLTIVDGEILVRDGQPVRVDLGEITAQARTAARELTTRAGV
jgi:5-methylthioadenosine/S-adenosylhomocysteine deaminase